MGENELKNAALNEPLKACAKMWAGESQNYVLVKTSVETQDDCPWLNCAIFYLPNGTIDLIEDDMLASEVKRRMYAAGVPIVDADTFRSILKMYKG